MSLEEEATYIRSTVFKLFKYVRSMERCLDQSDRGDSVTMVQGAVLRHITMRPGLSLKELSEKLGLAHSTISGIIDRLEKKNMVERRTDENDKRFVRLYLTNNVHSYLLHQRPRMFDEAIAKRLELLNEEEREQVRAGMQVLEKIFFTEENH